MSEESNTPDTQNRRRGFRIASETPLRLTVDAQDIQGRSDNFSSNGVLFLTDDKLRVKVEFEDEGLVVSVSGRLVRVQRAQGGSQGWAVEFDA